MRSRSDHNIEAWALLVFYTMLVITMAVEVLRREIFAYSSIWGEEIVRYSFIYLAWIGASAAVRERAHIRIDVLFNFCPVKVKAALYILGDLVMLSVAVIALIWSMDSVMTAIKFGSVTHGLRVPFALFLFAVPLGFSLMTYRLVQSIKFDLECWKEGREPFEGGQLFDEEQSS
ncbi:MAG: TRAP transporter small permease [Gammaproteobacteria bacterium]|jgi:C4-dicarboxylate transporter DctQ subunit|nr:TRAP transporter small permease [Gammaproteobacteria bacterium]NCW73531.1 TRAP transporter small permease [Gammaproteobacteria bacterium]